MDKNRTMTSLFSKIIIGIGTFRRNELLQNGLNYIAQMNIPKNILLEVILVDNCPDLTAKVAYEKNKDKMPFPIYYFAESKKSIAAVRNKALKEAINLGAEYIAFMDDDEYPSQTWLQDLYNTLIKYDADAATSFAISVINGKEAKIPNSIKRRKTGDKRVFCITNSVLFKVKISTEGGIWFDEEYGLMTGEDIDFFDRAYAKGYKFIWCSEAKIYEKVVENRLSFEWELDRSYNNGYMSVFKSRKQGKLKFDKSFKKALLDTIFFGILTLSTKILTNNTKNKYLCKLWKSFGKLNSLFRTDAYEHYKRNETPSPEPAKT